jgi:hypothetical protein
VQVDQALERADAPNVWHGWADVKLQRSVDAFEQVIEVRRNNLWLTGSAAREPQDRCVGCGVGAPGSPENAVDYLVHLVAPVFLVKEVEDAIQVLRTVALLEESSTLGFLASAERCHYALGQFGKAGEARWLRHARSAKEDNVASIALLKKLNWDTRTVYPKTHTPLPPIADFNSPMRVTPPTQGTVNRC